MRLRTRHIWLAGWWDSARLFVLAPKDSMDLCLGVLKGFLEVDTVMGFFLYGLPFLFPLLLTWKSVVDQVISLDSGEKEE